MRRMLVGFVVGMFAVSALATEPNVPVKGITQPPTMVDVNGRVLGPAIGYSEVLLRFEQFSILTALDRGSWYQEYPVLFAEPGCTGTAYAFVENPSGWTRGIVTAGPLDGQFTLHVIGDRGEVTTTSSFLWQGECGDYPPTVEMVWSVIQTYDLSHMFQPPFRIR